MIVPRWFLPLPLAVALLTSTASAEVIRNAAPLPILKPGAWDTVKLKWDHPEDENNDSGMPVGNGYFGGKIKGGIGRESIDLNDLTFWSKGPSDNQDPKRQQALVQTRKFLAVGDVKSANEAAQKMWGSPAVGEYTPIGKLTISFDHGNPAADYHRELDLDRALATVSYTVNGVTYTRETFASFPDRVLVMRLTASAPGKLSFTAGMEYPPPMEGHGASVATEGNNVLVMIGKAPAASGWDPAKGMSAQARLQVFPKGGRIAAAGKTLRIEGADSAVLLYADATSFNGFDKEPGTQGIDPAPVVKRLLAAAATKSYDQLLAAHLQDYQSLSRRLWVEINGEKPNAYALGLQYARYDMIASSRTGQAPHNLQGMWNRAWNPVNQGSYFLNENVEKYYSLIEPANLGDTGTPLWNFIENLAVRGTTTAKIDWGFHGWVAPHYTDLWCDAVIKGGDNCWAIWPMGGAWVCQNLWEHYAFGLDQNFLRRAYPTLKGQAEFVLDLLVDDGKGHLTPSPSSSPENSFNLPGGRNRYAVSQGSAADLSLTRQLFANVIQASQTLNLDSDFRQKLQGTLARLAPLKIANDGRVQEWSEDNATEDEPHHRHASNLLGVWPLAVITRGGTPDLFAAAKLSLAARGSGGYHPDKASMWARLGEGDRALKSEDDFYTGNHLVGQWNPKYAAFCEMLVQSHAGGIDLLPALPTSWASGKIVGVRARGGVELSLEWEKGELKKCQIDAHGGPVPTVRYRDKVIDLANDSRVTLNLLRN